MLGKVKKANIPNHHHQNTCYKGCGRNWKKMFGINSSHCFQALMVAWFGGNRTLQWMEKIVMYHSDANCVNICMHHMDHFIGIEFLFKLSYPLVLDD